VRCEWYITALPSNLALFVDRANKTTLVENMKEAIAVEKRIMALEKKNVQEVKDHIEHQEMNPTISCNALEEITTPQTLKIEGHIKKKKIQAVKDHIKHQKLLQILKDNASLVKN